MSSQVNLFLVTVHMNQLSCTAIINNKLYIYYYSNNFFSVATKSIQSHMAKRKENTSQMQISLQKSSNLYIYPYLRMKQKSIDFFLTTEAKCLYCS